MHSRLPAILTVALVFLALLSGASAQDRKKPAPPFAWVNDLRGSQKDLPGIRHATFRSPSMDLEIGYCVYLPPGYDEADAAKRRFPVVYMLHGGRPGNETKLITIAPYIDRAIRAGTIPPTIYVFNNGGPVSHYDYPGKDKALGNTALVEELIPHIDATYRTIASRAGRSIEGYSQGGRGTLRTVFAHPELFCAASAGSAGVQHEKRVSENNGAESDTVRFTPGDDAWSLARRYARKGNPGFRLMLYYGDEEDFNYAANLEYGEFLDSLGIPHRKLLVGSVPHSTVRAYEKKAADLLRFHADAFRASGALAP